MKIIVFGATGMVGEGVLFTALNDPRVEQALVVNRHPCGVQHEKLQEIIHKDFWNIEPISEQLKEYDAAFFCLGVSSVGMKPDDYYHITYDLTMHVATVLHRLNPDMTFCYVSGAGTDDSEQGRIRWARVKGKTENELRKLFKNSYMFRPGYIQPIKGMKHTYRIYKIVAPLYPVWKTLFPKMVCTLHDLGRAMLNCAEVGYEKNVLENTDITKLAE